MTADFNKNNIRRILQSRRFLFEPAGGENMKAVVEMVSRIKHCGFICLKVNRINTADKTSGKVSLLKRACDKVCHFIRRTMTRCAKA